MPKKPKTLVKRRAKKPKSRQDYFVHPTAIIEDNVQIGKGAKIWHYSQIRKNTHIGRNCVIGNSVFIDFDTIIGDNVKIQNRAIIYHQAIIENGVFVGPNVCFTNDKMPRAVNPDGSLKSADDWQVSTIRVGEGASIGAHSVITPGVTVGKWAMVGAGSVVTKDIPNFALVYGNPARIYDFVCKCGRRLKKIGENNQVIIGQCVCGIQTIIPEEIYKLKEKNNLSVGGKTKVWLK